MARVRSGRDGITVELAREELDLLVRLLDGLAVRLRSGGSGAVVERLAPAASHGDAEADHELRRMLRSDLLEGRAERLTRLAVELRGWGERSGGSARVVVTLDGEVAVGLVQGLNDVRLALGARIDVEALDRATLTPEDPRTATLVLMDQLGGLQQLLVEELDGP
jgi:hypothetical protein